MKKVVITGGLGYIGSHIASILGSHDRQVIVVDDASVSDDAVLARIRDITEHKPIYYNISLHSHSALQQVFADHPDVELVIHAAGDAAVRSSFGDPLDSYAQRTGAIINLLQAMESHRITKLIAISSSAVYDTELGISPFTEKDRIANMSPYASGMLSMEYILEDMARYKGRDTVILRLPQALGAHPSGLIGRTPDANYPTVMDSIYRVSLGQQEKVPVNGNDYETEDGTLVRDYIHVMDIAEAILGIYDSLAQQRMDHTDTTEGVFQILNMSTGEGVSVLQIIETASSVLGMEIPYEIAEKMPHDDAMRIINPQKAFQLLGRKAQRTLFQAIEDGRKFLKGQQSDVE